MPQILHMTGIQISSTSELTEKGPSPNLELGWPKDVRVYHINNTKHSKNGHIQHTKLTYVDVLHLGHGPQEWPHTTHKAHFEDTKSKTASNFSFEMDISKPRARNSKSSEFCEEAMKDNE